MKRIILILVATFMMGGMIMAQHARRDNKMADPKVRAERMTERMVKEYSLNDAQKQQLLDANLALVGKMGDMPMRHRGEMRKGRQGKKGCCEACTCNKTGKQHKKATKADRKEGKKPQLTDEQLAQKKAEKAKKMEEMKAARETYSAQLQKIMTKDQYAAYKKNMQDKKDKMDSRKKESK